MCSTATEVETRQGGPVAWVEVGGSRQVKLIQGHGTVEDILQDSEQTPLN